MGIRPRDTEERRPKPEVDEGVGEFCCSMPWVASALFLYRTSVALAALPPAWQRPSPGDRPIRDTCTLSFGTAASPTLSRP